MQGVTGLYMTLNCSVIGNPIPKIQWYRNGKHLQYNPIINYQEGQLIIRTADNEHEGIYQCLATNINGEQQIIGQITLETRSNVKRPENLRCYPINYSTMKITFETEHKVI